MSSVEEGATGPAHISLTLFLSTVFVLADAQKRFFFFFFPCIEKLLDIRTHCSPETSVRGAHDQSSLAASGMISLVTNLLTCILQLQ